MNFAKLKGGDKVAEGDDDEDEESEVTAQVESGSSGSPPAANNPASRQPKADGGQAGNVYTVQQAGDRLKITADVDIEGIKKLKLLIEQYEQILKLMN